MNLFSRENCVEDEHLRREVKSLLNFENTSDSFLDTPPESVAAEMLAEQEDDTNLRK